MQGGMQDVTGASGARLAARPDLPGGPPRGAAPFAHRFTCGKDIAAAREVAAGLVQAVATPGAPSDPAHALHLFGPAPERIRSEGRAEVTLGGRGPSPSRGTSSRIRGTTGRRRRCAACVCR